MNKGVEKVSEEKKVETVAAPKKASKKFWYFKNLKYSGLTLLVRGGKDEFGDLGIAEQARFVAYYDTWKGDVVRVGYLKTDSKAIYEAAINDSSCIEIDEKEYKEAIEGNGKNIKPLRKVPVTLA